MKEVDYYLRAPWSINASTEGEYKVLRIAELPGFVVAAKTADELDEDFWPALQTFLESYVEDGEVPPLPEGYGAFEDAPPVDPPGTTRTVESFSTGNRVDWSSRHAFA